MKRLFFTIICISVVVVSVAAQTARLSDFTMRGVASQEMKNQGLVAAHASFPLNSAVKITNPRNGLEVEVIITERIEPSLNRIIDLSASAMGALEMKSGEQVILTVGSPPRIVQPPSEIEDIVDVLEPVWVAEDNYQPVDSEQFYQEPVIEQAAAEETPEQIFITQNPVELLLAELPISPVSSVQGYPVQVIEALKNPIIKEAYVTASKKGRSAEFLAWLMAMTLESRESRDIRDARMAREEREIREMREIREAREAREARAAREARLAREEREIREAREARIAREEREEREEREAREARQYRY